VGVRVRFENIKTGFQVIFYRPKSTVPVAHEKASQKASQKTSQKTSQKIMELIMADPSITIESLARNLGITDRAIKMQIQNLKKKGLIQRIGPDKGGYWQIQDKL
jgi:ATP-dependent DNA helicase RecG